MKYAIEQLHAYLAKPLHDQEALARESQRLAVGKLAMLEKQLTEISPGSLSLKGRSFTDLMGLAGLSHVVQMLQGSQNASEVPVATPPATPSPPPIRAAARPIVTPTPTPVARPARMVPAVAYSPPPQPPRLIDPGMAKLREISRKAMTSPAPTKPPIEAQGLKNQVSRPTASAPAAATPSPIVSPPAPSPIPVRASATAPPAPAAKTILPEPKLAPTVRPTVTPLSSTTPKKEGLSITNTNSTKIPAKPANPENSPAKTDPEKKPSVIAASPPPIFSEAEERLEKERRDRHRAILSNPPPRPRGGWER